MTGVASESRHLSVHVERPPTEVYAYAADQLHLPEWAPGLCTAVERDEGRWFADSGMGRIELTFTPANPYGVLDHDVRLPGGETFRNPMRVLPHDDGSELVFTAQAARDDGRRLRAGRRRGPGRPRGAQTHCRVALMA
ncbi:SRPBCC family protein [Dactylosporangium sp. NPDC051484]|uniref:SRPBCC family protein n=1 Tax=Dactylosporangium sp. NPDC051484 TaxID=3154942 RepID=UPI00344BC3D7